jgi:hypothetical protein
MKTNSFLYFLLFILFTGSCKNIDDNKENSATGWEQQQKTYIENSKKLAMNAGSILKGRLTNAIENGGIINGISVCNVVAQQLMDSISLANGTKIKRTGIKTRNDKNSPDQKDLMVLDEMTKKQKSGIVPSPVAIKQDNKIVNVYIPIMTEALCLNCHGKAGKDIKPDVYALIREKYPNDEATGYSLGELRGMWVIQMGK